MLYSKQLPKQSRTPQNVRQEQEDEVRRNAQTSNDHPLLPAFHRSPIITPQQVIHLQRLIGNQAVLRLLEDRIQCVRTSVSSISVEEPVVGDRLEVGFQATYNDSSTEDFGLNVSHKKHLLGSYFLGESAAAPSAATNTIVNISLEDFKKAFQDYARFLGEKHKTVFPAAVVPSDPGNEYTSRMGISVHADRDHLSTNIHSFPTTQGTNAVSLDQDTHKKFKKVLNFLYIGESDPATAQGMLRDWNSIRGNPAIVALIPDLQRIQITLRLKALVSIKGEHRELTSHRARLGHDPHYISKEEK